MSKNLAKYIITTGNFDNEYNNVDACYDRIKLLCPEAKLSKGKDCVIVERGEE